MKRLLPFLLLALPAIAQQDRPVRLFPIDPTGACNVVTEPWLNWLTGNLWVCVGTAGVGNGTWHLVSGSGGGISGLTPYTIPMAATSSTVSNSNFFELAADFTLGANRTINQVAPQSISPVCAGTTNIDWAVSPVASITLTCNTTLGTPTHPHGSGHYTLQTCQDPTGSRVYTAFPASFLGAQQPDPTASTCTNQDFDYDGVNYEGKTATCPLCPPFVGVPGSTSGVLKIQTAAVAGINALKLPAASTDFTATGGASNVVKQTSVGGAFSVGRLACADLSDSQAGCSGAGGSAPYSNWQGSVGSQAVSGTTTIYTFTNVGPLAAGTGSGSCLDIDSIVWGSTSTLSSAIVTIGGTQVVHTSALGGSGAGYVLSLTICNNNGVQNAQTYRPNPNNGYITSLTANAPNVWTGYNDMGTLVQQNVDSNVNTSSAFTLTIAVTGSAGNVQGQWAQLKVH